MSDRILRLPDVVSMVGIKRSSIYDFMKKGIFPASIPLGEKAVGWRESEIAQWVEQRTQLRAVKKRP